MSVPYTGLEAQIVNKVAGMLADCATFQALVGAADAAAARVRIIEVDDVPPAGAHAGIYLPDISGLAQASTDHVLGTASVEVVLTWPPPGGLTATESFRDAMNTGSAINRELWLGGDELLAGIDAAPAVLLDESDGDLAGWFEKVFTITLRCLP